MLVICGIRQHLKYRILLANACWATKQRALTPRLDDSDRERYFFATNHCTIPVRRNAGKRQFCEGLTFA